MRKRLGKNSFYNLIKSCATALFPLITFPYVSRVLKPEYVGRHNFAFTIISYFMMLASLGITTYAVRECAKCKEDRDALSKTASQIFSINMIATIISCVLLFICIATVPRLRSCYDLLILMSATILFTTLGTEWLNTAIEDFKYITIRTLIFQIMATVLIFTLVRKPEDYFKYAAISVLSTCGAFALNMFYVRRYCKIRFTFRLDIKKHLFPIIGLFAMIISQHIFIATDTTMIGFFYDDYEVGIYSTALKIYNILSQLIGSITWVVFSQLSLCFSKRDYVELKNIQKFALQFMGVLGIPCIIGIFMMHNEIIVNIVGADYTSSGTVLKVLAVTLLASFSTNYVLNINILASGKDKIALTACMTAAILNVVLNWIFIPLYGIIAAAWTTVIAQLAIIFICSPFIDKRCEIGNQMKVLWKPCVASIGLIIICFISKTFISESLISLLFSIFVGGTVYLVILLLLKEEFTLGIISKVLRR